MDGDTYSSRCTKCGKRITGYTINHLNFLMEQHQWIHSKTKIEDGRVEINSSSLHIQDKKEVMK